MTADLNARLEAILQAAAGEYAIIHFECRGDTFRVWPPDNAAPFSVAVVQTDEVERLRALERNALRMAKDPNPAYAACANWILTGGG